VNIDCAKDLASLVKATEIPWARIAVDWPEPVSSKWLMIHWRNSLCRKLVKRLKSSDATPRDEDPWKLIEYLYDECYEDESEVHWAEVTRKLLLSDQASVIWKSLTKLLPLKNKSFADKVEALRSLIGVSPLNVVPRLPLSTCRIAFTPSPCSAQGN
jgi:hypothetical protein